MLYIFHLAYENDSGTLDPVFVWADNLQDAYKALSYADHINSLGMPDHGIDEYRTKGAPVTQSDWSDHYEYVHNMYTMDISLEQARTLKIEEGGKMQKKSITGFPALTEYNSIPQSLKDA